MTKSVTKFVTKFVTKYATNRVSTLLIKFVIKVVTRGFKALKMLKNSVFKQADNGNRTRDLRTTNATLYRLSYISTNKRYITKEKSHCQ